MHRPVFKQTASGSCPVPYDRGVGEPLDDYPLSSRRPDEVTTPAGVPLAGITLQALRAGALDAQDLRASRRTLERQAAIARAAGQGQLASSLERGAELADVPDEIVLALYTALRPRRSSGEELERWAGRLEAEFGAPRTAAFVREAREVYATRDLLAGGPR